MPSPTILLLEVLFRGKYRVSVSPAPEAASVLWANFRTGARGGKLVQLAIARIT